MGHLPARKDATHNGARWPKPASGLVNQRMMRAEAAPVYAMTQFLMMGPVTVRTTTMPSPPALLRFGWPSLPAVGSGVI